MPLNRMKHYVTVATVMFFMISSTSYAMDLTIGLVPEQNIFKQIKKYQILDEYIERKSDININFTILSSHEKSIADFKKRNLDGAFLCSLTGADAKDKLEVAYIANIVNTDGRATSRSYLFTHKDSSIEHVEQMRYRVMAFVDKATTAGYAFPVAYLRDHGINDINGFFKDYFFTGSHDASIYAVLNKEADIGASKSSVFDMLAKKDVRITSNLKIIVSSNEFPSNVLVLKKDLPLDIKNRLKSILVNMDSSSDGKQALKAFGAMKFIEARESDYHTIADGSGNIELSREKDLK